MKRQESKWIFCVMFSINAKSKKWGAGGVGRARDGGCEGMALPWPPSVCVVAAGPERERGPGL